MEANIFQYEARVEFEESKLEDIEDEEDRAEQEIRINSYKDELSKIESDHRPFINFIEENYGEEE